MNYWDKLYGQMQMKASATKDAEANKLLTQLVLVPREVKWDVLRKYVDKCCVLHAVAFFQWRIKYPSKVRHDIEELTEIVEGRISHFANHGKEQTINEETL